MVKTRILDGGMSRELVRLGAQLRQPEWSALALWEAPDTVRRVHQDFIDAGAEVITTNSYALVPFHIGEERFREQGASLIALSGRLAREAADSRADSNVLVAGSLPPVFGSYEPQRFDAARVQDYLGVLVENLSPFVDVWLGETLSLIAEADAVRIAVAKTGKPFWISFTVEDADADATPGALEPRLRSEETVRAASQWAAGSGAAAMLFNCSRPEFMLPAVKIAAETFAKLGATLEIGVYANAFEPDREGAANETLSGTRQDLTADCYARFSCDWADAGASMIGGCCGIGASHIEGIAHALRQRPTQ